MCHKTSTWARSRFATRVQVNTVFLLEAQDRTIVALLDTGYRVSVWWGSPLTGNNGIGESLAYEYRKDCKRGAVAV